MLVNGITRLFNGGQTSDTSNPSRLLLKIVILQCSYYLTALIFFYLVSSLNGYEFNASWVFQWDIIRSDNAMGWTLFFLWLLDTLFCVLFVTIIVGRSKLAWDFAVTIHVINLIVVWIYTKKFPTSVLWWLLQILSGVVLLTLSTYLTKWKELRTTFFDNMLDQERGRVDHYNDPVKMSDLNRK